MRTLSDEAVTLLKPLIKAVLEIYISMKIHCSLEPQNENKLSPNKVGNQ